MEADKAVFSLTLGNSPILDSPLFTFLVAGGPSTQASNFKTSSIIPDKFKILVWRWTRLIPPSPS
jgi:hypothetical protein